MPHKRKRQSDDDSSHNLPPSTSARPLSVGKSNARKSSDDVRKSNTNTKTARKKTSLADDTPKAFKRLMTFRKTGKRPNGLDDGHPSQNPKRQRRNKDIAEIPVIAVRKPLQEWEAPKIQPGEHMSDFRARVNRELPISGLVKKGKKGEGMRESQTRTEKKIQRKIALWREEEARRKEREEEKRDAADQEEAADFNVTETLSAGSHGKRGRAKRSEDEDDDPWAKLKTDRGQRAGLHDVAQAPPDFKRMPTRKFKVKEGATVDVANVPRRGDSSLRKREQLQDTRMEIIESYRNFMNDRSHGSGGG